LRSSNPEQMRLNLKRGQHAKRRQQHEYLYTVHIKLQGRFETSVQRNNAVGALSNRVVTIRSVQIADAGA
jgi:hypothetical protein